MSLLDNNFNVSENDLNKEIAIRLVRLSRSIYRHKIASNNVIYHEPHKNVKNKHNYYLSIGYASQTGYYHIKWLSDRSRRIAHMMYYTVYVDYTPIALYDFDNIDELLKQIERYENKNQ